MFNSEAGLAGTFSEITSIWTEVQGELPPPQPTDRTLIVANPLKASSHCIVPLRVGRNAGGVTVTPNWIDCPKPTGAAEAVNTVLVTAASIIIWFETFL